MLFMLQTNIYKKYKAAFKFSRFLHRVIRFFCNSDIKHKYQQADKQLVKWKLTIKQ